MANIDRTPKRRGREKKTTEENPEVKPSSNAIFRRAYWTLKFRDWRAWVWENGLKSDIVRATILLVGIAVAMYAFFPVWWVQRLKENFWWLAIGVGVLLLGVKFGKQSKVPISHRIGPFAKVMGTLVIVFFLFLKSDYGQAQMEEWRQVVKDWVWASEQVKTEADLASLPNGFVTSSENPRHWTNHVTDENRKIVEMIKVAVQSELPEKQQDLAMQIAWEESEFRQYSSGDTVLTHVNDNKSVDYGVFQINSVWLEKSKELGEGYKIDGPPDENIRMAMWIWTDPSTRGPRAWTGTYNRALAVLRNSSPGHGGGNGAVLARGTPTPAEPARIQLVAQGPPREALKQVLTFPALFAYESPAPVTGLESGATMVVEGGIVHYQTDEMRARGETHQTASPGQEISLEGARWVKPWDPRHVPWHLAVKFREQNPDLIVRVTIKRWQ